MYADEIMANELDGCPAWDYKDKKVNVRRYIQYALDRFGTAFKIEGTPDSIPPRVLKRQLLTGGFSLVHRHTDGELYCYLGGLGGERDVYYEPTLATVSNPAQNLSAQWKIGEDCVLIRNDSYMLGVLPMFTRYATQLVESDITMYIAGINMRIPFMVSASDDDTEESARTLIDDIAAGKMGVVAEQAFFDGVKIQPTGNLSNYITQLIEHQQYIKASWNMDIGLNSNWNGKREAITANESMLNDDALMPLVDDILSNWKDGFERVNKMFGTNWTVELDPESPWGKRKLECAECGEEINEEEVSENEKDENEPYREDGE